MSHPDPSVACINMSLMSLRAEVQDLSTLWVRAWSRGQFLLPILIRGKNSGFGVAEMDCFVFFAFGLGAGAAVAAVVVSCICGRALPLHARCPSTLFGRLAQHRLSHKDISTDQLHLRHALRLQLARAPWKCQRNGGNAQRHQ